MLQFRANMEVQEDLGKQVKIMSNMYKVYRVKVATLEMLAYFDSKEKISVGDFVVSEHVHLTNDRDTLDYVDIVLCVGKFDVVPKEEFIAMGYLEVYITGRFIRTAKAKLRVVGKTNKPFLATTVAFRNENGVYINLLLASFHKKAEELNMVETNTFMKVRARLCKKVYQPGYELNLTHFEVI